MAASVSAWRTSRSRVASPRRKAEHQRVATAATSASVVASSTDGAEDVAGDPAETPPGDQADHRRRDRRSRPRARTRAGRAPRPRARSRGRLRARARPRRRPGEHRAAPTLRPGVRERPAEGERRRAAERIGGGNGEDGVGPGGDRASAAILTTRSSRSAVAPKAPIVGSRMISSARSRLAAPEAVRAVGERVEVDRAGQEGLERDGDARRRGGGQPRVEPDDDEADERADARPRRPGRATAPRATSSPSRATRRPTGTRVRKERRPPARSAVSGACIGDARGLEGGHVREDRERGGQERQRERAPLPSPSRRPRSRSGRSPRSREDERVAGLRRAVRGDHSPGAAGASRAATSAAAPVTNPSRRTTRPRAAAEADAGEDGELEAADGGQHADRIGGIGSVDRQRRAHRLDLAREAVVVDARPAAADGLRLAGAARRRRAAAAVVLPMPMSPVATIPKPSPASSSAIAAPARMPATASARLIAGPSRRVGGARAEAQPAGSRDARPARRRRRPRRRAAGPSRARARRSPPRRRRRRRASAPVTSCG